MLLPITFRYKGKDIFRHISLNTFLSRTQFLLSSSRFDYPEEIKTEDGYPSKEYSFTFTIEESKTILTYQMILFELKHIPKILIERGVGLNYKGNDEQSFVYTLYKNKVIGKKLFAFEGKKNQIHFGGIPNDNYTLIKNKAILPIDLSLPTWGFNLRQIIFKNHVYDINTPCIVINNKQDMFYSDELFELFITHYSDIWISNEE